MFFRGLFGVGLARRLCPLNVSVAGPRAFGAISFAPGSHGFTFAPYTAPKPANGEVTLKTLAAVVKPTDLGSGKGFAGNEGIAYVDAVGPGVTGLAPGDWVVPTSSGLGMWRSELTCAAKTVRKVPNTLPLPSAALLGHCLPTALALSQYFHSLDEGDVVFQNCAGEAIGMMVVQLAAQAGVATINITPELSFREDNKLREMVKMLGGTAAVTTEFLTAGDCAKRLVGSSKAVLGFDGAGGDDASVVANLLSPGGTLVSYGATAPSALPKGIKGQTFAMDTYLGELTAQEKKDFFNALDEIVAEKTVRVPMEEHVFGEGFDATAARAQEIIGRTVFVTMASPLPQTA